MPNILVDEFGHVNVFSEERLAKLKEKANEQHIQLCEIIKKSETALGAIVEFLGHAEKNERVFYTIAKAYIESLKAVENESYKPKF